MARWSSGQDVGLSRRKRGFDSPTGHQTSHIRTFRFVYGAIYRLSACVAIDFDTGIIATVEVDFVDEGVYQSRSVGVIIGIAFLEFLKEELHFVKGEHRTHHLFAGELGFKVVTLSLAFLNLRGEHINRFPALDGFDEICGCFFVFTEQLSEPFNRAGNAFLRGQGSDFGRYLVYIFSRQCFQNAVYHQVLYDFFLNGFAVALAVLADGGALVVLVNCSCVGMTAVTDHSAAAFAAEQARRKQIILILCLEPCRCFLVFLKKRLRLLECLLVNDLGNAAGDLYIVVNVNAKVPSV